MRVTAGIGLVAAIAVSGWGLWLLYARFAGGPEDYAGTPDPGPLREIEEKLAELKRSRANLEASTSRLRAQVEKWPPADARRDEAERLLAEEESKRPERDATLARFELLRDGLARDYDQKLDDARTRTLRRGILFTAVGLVWSFRAVSALRRPTGPSESTAVPAPSPLSPRPDD